MNHVLFRRERSGVINEDQVPRRIDEPVPEVRVNVANEVVEHLRANQLAVPGVEFGWRRGRRSTKLFETLYRRDPHDCGAGFAFYTAFDGRRDHVEPE